MTGQQNERALRFAVVMLAALVAHELGDFPGQTDKMANRKGAPGYNPENIEVSNVRSWLANQAHCTEYNAVMAAVVGATCKTLGIKVTWRRALAGLGVSWVTHAIIDRRWPVVGLMKLKGTPLELFPVQLAIDQSFHKAALLIAVLITVSQGRTTPKEPPMPSLTLIKSLPDQEPPAGPLLGDLGAFADWLGTIPAARDWIAAEEPTGAQVHVITGEDRMPPGDRPYLTVPVSPSTYGRFKATAAKAGQ